MQAPLVLFLFLSFFVISVDTVYRVRKFIQRPATRRSVADDDLDMAAADMIFKEKQTLKPLTSSGSSDNIEAPPTARKLPFGTEDAVLREDSIGAPSAEPSFSELKKTNLEEIEKEEEGNLKSSMVGEVGDGAEKLEEEGFLTTMATATVGSPFGMNDGETSSGRVPAWQQPLKTNGRMVAYDFQVNPEYPQFAPRARGLVGIPDGWNLDKQIDEEFRSGFRNVDFRRRFHH